MSDGWELRVLTGANSLLTERLTRELRSHLGSHGVESRFAEAATVSTGHKSGVSLELILLVSAGFSAGSARVLTTLIREWCERDRRRQVEMRFNGNSGELVIDGNNDEQLAVIDRFVEEMKQRHPDESGQRTVADPRTEHIAPETEPNR
ncbi:hypothetical protein GV792_17315 [Nocardia cyriacigeorgica]|uniref:Uncharacterized protein n=1 Tax=Nocardia cyriacigeorgica TaxID=135487 RepID=A0A6P1DCD5_9NOCA|nr:hypothetical protein [Nocardia cyriacigeorgica]NEW40202.1 hypothetical protein [Nocardia cyriacigeorgica]NEW47261.1 hypothetical protein [Nocardia cyriacigeorgica]NEW51803.1 hypothetical protein [Nocardia cyriacigeorgica]